MRVYYSSSSLPHPFPIVALFILPASRFSSHFRLSTFRRASLACATMIYVYIFLGANTPNPWPSVDVHNLRFRSGTNEQFFFVTLPVAYLTTHFTSSLHHPSTTQRRSLAPIASSPLPAPGPFLDRTG
ncbi:hypothetical protein BDN72DRAFT_53402 [Pluteus cervinus]|uniref:Uncharacterized protein n=1 Tax=Pluteus cervinus TaxID=181527 RepID=A0ACD3B9N8_9AGAR|nr:hypothetical protein BDN72DRAFT_53402 [Pluteus cervinus]